MSLIKKHEMTEKHLAANRRNQDLGNGPERRGRIRAALLRFGFDARAEKAATRAPGEEPAHSARRTLGGAPNAGFQVPKSTQLTTLLLKIKRSDRQMEALERTASFHYVQETKGISV
jgi:hypothetical protein